MPQQIEDLLRKIESTADPSLRANVQELVELIMNLHGSGLERMLELIRSSDGADTLIKKLGRDELVANLLVLYGLHPLNMEERVTQALDKVRSRLRPHGGEVELLNIEGGAIRLRLQAKGRSLKEMVEEAVYQAAPDLTSLTVESPEEGFVPLAMLLESHPDPAPNGKGRL